MNQALLSDMTMGLIQVAGAGFLGVSVLQLFRRKYVGGVSAVTVSFWVAWGLWDLYYWPSLGQWWAFGGAVVVTMMNMLYVGLIVLYNYRERRLVHGNALAKFNYFARRAA
jgi:hypothetical protein